MIRGASGGTRCCFTCSVTLITLGCVCIMMGIGWTVGDLLRTAGIVIIIFGVVLVCSGVGSCCYSRNKAKQEFEERYQRTLNTGPVMCGLLPGQTVAGDYRSQQQPQPQQPGAYSQQPGAYSQQPGAYSQQPGAYSQQPGAYSQQPYNEHSEPHPPPSAVMGSPPSYDEVVYGPNSKGVSSDV